MQIQYQILNYIPEQASIVVKYFTDKIPNGLTYTLDIPIIDGQLAGEEEILKLIEIYTPKGQLERLENLLNVEHPTHLTSLIIENTNTSETNNINGDVIEVTRGDIANLQITLAIQRVLAEMSGATV